MTRFGVFLGILISIQITHGVLFYPMSRKQIGTGSLAGCAEIVYSVNVQIGNQTFELILDTGSSTTAVAAYPCDSCLTNQKYTPGSTAVDQDATASAVYGDGSGWAGEIFSDNTIITGIPLAAFKFVAIVDQSQFFVGVDCYNDNIDESVSLYDGILGMAYQRLLAPGTQSMIDRLYTTGVLTSNIFSVTMCGINQGEMSIGGLNTSLVRNTSLIYWTPITTTSYFYVAVSGITFGNAEVLTAGGSPLAFIVDTGTTQTYLPTTLYNTIVALLNGNNYWLAAFGSDYWNEQACASLPGGGDITVGTLNEFLPQLQIVFNGFILPLIPMRSLVFSVEVEGGTCYAPGIADAEGGLNVIGFTTLNNYVTIFDLATAQIGFYSPTTSAGAECYTGLSIKSSSAISVSVTWVHFAVLSILTTILSPRI